MRKLGLWAVRPKRNTSSALHCFRTVGKGHPGGHDARHQTVLGDRHQRGVQHTTLRV
jgi:hypothetical protein